MRIPSTATLLLVGVCAVGLAGCSSSGSGSPPTTAPTTTAPTTTPSTGSSTVASTTTAPAAAAAAVNVPVTDAIRSQLVAAGAAVNTIPVSEYSGLAPGLTFYALDRQTGTHWAGARLVPAPSSDPSSPTRAQVASQDDGSYYLFEQPRGAGWTAHATGASGPDTPCPIAVPAAVAAVWGWPSGTCRPPGA
jgi:hypothetical protein